MDFNWIWNRKNKNKIKDVNNLKDKYLLSDLTEKDLGLLKNKPYYQPQNIPERKKDIENYIFTSKQALLKEFGKFTTTELINSSQESKDYFSSEIYHNDGEGTPKETIENVAEFFIRECNNEREFQEHDQEHEHDIMTFFNSPSQENQENKNIIATTKVEKSIKTLIIPSTPDHENIR